MHEEEKLKNERREGKLVSCLRGATHILTALNKSLLLL